MYFWTLYKRTTILGSSICSNGVHFRQKSVGVDFATALLDGCKEFAIGYNLQLKDEVVFLLLENSHILVQVYEVKK